MHGCAPALMVMLTWAVLETIADLCVAEIRYPVPTLGDALQTGVVAAEGRVMVASICTGRHAQLAEGVDAGAHLAWRAAHLTSGGRWEGA